ncbi:hypothetical protein QPL22_21530 [Escherichia coli]|nr:hypothetical protein [Escherichia coli]MDS1718042.1 hypothetical protein [Escherichia coli]
MVVERWILMRLRHEVFHTLTALNLAISELLQELNERPFLRLPGCRKSLYEKQDKPARKALPPYWYEYVDIRRAKGGPDYHVLYGKHAYSVPHALIGSHINIEAGARLVRLYHREYWLPSIHGRSNRAASPRRQNICRSRIVSAPRTVVAWHLHHRAHPEQAYRSCLGLPNLSREYGGR